MQRPCTLRTHSLLQYLPTCTPLNANKKDGILACSPPRSQRSVLVELE